MGCRGEVLSELGFLVAVAIGLGAITVFGVCQGAFQALPPKWRGEIAFGRVLATTIVVVGAVFWLVGTMGRPLGAATAFLLTLLVGLTSAVLGDKVGRLIGRERPEAWADRVRTPVAWWVAAARPLGWLTSVADDDWRLVASSIELANDEGVDDEEEDASVALFPLESTTVREIMTPRPDIVSVSAAASLDDVVETIRGSGRSRIPITGDDLDEIKGVVYAKDLVRFVHGVEAPPPGLCEMAREPVFVPEAKPIDDLLREFQRDRIHLAIVVDEYGGTAGVVTLEDVLEEVVGEIRDEYDRETPLVEEVGEDRYVLDGRLDVDDFNLRMGSRLDATQVETMGGFVARELGTIAEGGEVVTVDGWSFGVTAVEGKRITRITAERCET